jgi:hypothetical protein
METKPDHSFLPSAAQTEISGLVFSGEGHVQVALQQQLPYNLAFPTLVRG